MKNLVMILLFSAGMVQAQEVKTVPQISVSGEGKIKVTPDEALIKVYEKIVTRSLFGNTNASRNSA